MHAFACVYLETLYGDEMTLSFRDPRGWPGVLAAIGRQLPALLELSLLTLPRTRPLAPPRSPDVKKGRAQ